MSSGLLCSWATARRPARRPARDFTNVQTHNTKRQNNNTRTKISHWWWLGSNNKTNTEAMVKMGWTREQWKWHEWFFLSKVGPTPTPLHLHVSREFARGWSSQWWSPRKSWSTSWINTWHTYKKIIFGPQMFKTVFFGKKCFCLIKKSKTFPFVFTCSSGHAVEILTLFWFLVLTNKIICGWM